MAKRVAAVILAAGIGSRMMSDKTKQKIEILGKSVLLRTLEAFDKCNVITSITIVIRRGEEAFVNGESSQIKKPINIVYGGATRAESARLGFLAIPNDSEFVAIHDAARCLVTDQMIKSVAEAAFLYGAATASAKSIDTLKRTDKDGFVDTTLDRREIVRVQTPQIFAVPIYERAIENARIDAEITDDNMLVELIGQKIKCVDTGSTNIKITEPSDIALAASILDAERETVVPIMNMRVGHGYDVHRFADGRDLIIGGVNIPNDVGLLGHSDADVLIHAVMDALLGAAALGDIGKHFPDTSEEFCGISSMHLLAKVKKLLDENGYKISNIDATLVMQKPKVAPYVQKMRENIAFALSVDVSVVNVKATTEEKLGFTGACEGAAAHSVALIQK